VTLRQFEVFLAVARARSFRRAADALHLSQPALSQHVRELEGALGAPLFDRLGRSVHLTEAGRILVEHATRLFATLADARHAIADLQGLERGALAIGASTTPGIYVLPAVLGGFRQRYPAIDVTVQLGNSAEIAGLVRRGELDLAVVGDGGTTPAEATLAARVEDELVLIVGATHPWAGRRDVDPAELAGQPLLLREAGSATRQVTERALARAGVGYRPGLVLPHTEAIKQGVLAGLGVAFVSVFAIQGEQAAGRLRPLRVRGLRITRHFQLIHHARRRPSLAARAFVERFLATAPPAPVRRAGSPRRASLPSSRRPGSTAGARRGSGATSPARLVAGQP
jgi:DNA-binding transcriptional LysR family regulator